MVRIDIMINNVNWSQLSKRNENKFLTLCKKLKSKNGENPWLPFFAENTSIQNARINSWNKNDACYVSEIYVEKQNFELRLGCSGTDEMILTDSRRNEKRKIVLDEKRNSKFLNLNKDIDPEIIKNDALKLKETLQSIKDGYPVENYIPETAIFQLVSPIQVSFIFQLLEINSLSELATAVMLNTILYLEPPISSSIGAAIIRHVICPKIISLKTNTSRALTTAVLKFAEKYPRAIIDELLVPCFESETLESSQVDILQKIIKCSLPDDQILYCARRAVEYSVTSEDNAFTLIQVLLERKVSFDESFCHLLVDKMLKWSSNFHSNLKYSKLLICVISTFGSQLSAKQLSTMITITKSITTFLRKAAENLLKKCNISDSK